MTASSILQELWQTKDDLTREAGDDVARICENTRCWAAAHSHSGSVVNNALELRAWLAHHEETGLSVVCEDTPPYVPGNESLVQPPTKPTPHRPPRLASPHAHERPGHRAVIGYIDQGSDLSYATFRMLMIIIDSHLRVNSPHSINFQIHELPQKNIRQKNQFRSHVERARR